MSTGSAFDFIRIDVPCAKCGETDLQPLRELVAKPETTCGYCGAVIDLSTKDWQSFLSEATQIYKKIVHPSRL